MSYALSVFLVPEALLCQCVGKNDHVMLAQALEACEAQLADFDEQDDAPNFENYDVDISHADALREIFSGRYTEDVEGCRYGWALEALCEFLGERLDNSGFCPCRANWYFDLDEELESRGIALKFRDLIYDSPVDIPTPDDFPNIGHWSRKQIALLPQLEIALQTFDDGEMEEAVETAIGWLKQAADEPGSLIIGFHG